MPKYELDSRMQLFQQRALELICLEKLVESQLASRKVKQPTTAPVDSLASWSRNLEALVDALALADVPESYLRKVYANFEEVLRDCQAEVIFFTKKSDAEAFREAFQSGSTFQACSDKWGFRKPLNELLGSPPYTEATLARLLGPRGAYEVFRLRNGELSQPLSVDDEFVLLKVDGIRSSYEQLLPKVTNVVAFSRKQMILNSLSSQTTLVSFLPLQLNRDVHALEELPPVVPKDMKSPSVQSVVIPNSLPSPRPGEVQTPSGLPVLRPGQGQPVNILPGPKVGTEPVVGLPKPKGAP